MINAFSIQDAKQHDFLCRTNLPIFSPVKKKKKKSANNLKTTRKFDYWLEDVLHPLSRNIIFFFRVEVLKFLTDWF